LAADQRGVCGSALKMLKLEVPSPFQVNYGKRPEKAIDRAQQLPGATIGQPRRQYLYEFTGPSRLEGIKLTRLAVERVEAPQRSLGSISWSGKLHRAE